MKENSPELQNTVQRRAQWDAVKSNQSSGSILSGFFFLIKKKEISSHYLRRYTRLPLKTDSSMFATLKTRSCIISDFVWGETMWGPTLERKDPLPRGKMLLLGSSLMLFAVQIQQALWMIRIFGCILWIQVGANLHPRSALARPDCVC